MAFLTSQLPGDSSWGLLDLAGISQAFEPGWESSSFRRAQTVGLCRAFSLECSWDSFVSSLSNWPWKCGVLLDEVSPALPWEGIALTCSIPSACPRYCNYEITGPHLQGICSQGTFKRICVGGSLNFWNTAICGFILLDTCVDYFIDKWKECLNTRSLMSEWILANKYVHHTSSSVLKIRHHRILAVCCLFVLSQTQSKSQIYISDETNNYKTKRVFQKRLWPNTYPQFPGIANSIFLLCLNDRCYLLGWTLRTASGTVLEAFC